MAQMAFRRRVGRVRAPARRFMRRRRGRVARRSRRFRRRRSRSGNLTIKCRYSTVQFITPSEHKTYDVSCVLGDFPEAERLWDNFEAYRIWNIKVKIIPLFNVADPKSPVPVVITAPFHRAAPDLDANGILSLDRSKTHRGTSRIERNFVPAVLSAVQTQSIGSTASVKTVWRPRIELIGDNAAKIKHYGGLAYFEKPFGSQPITFERHYEVQLECTVTFYNQKGFNS